MNKKVIFVLGLVVIFALLPVSGYGSYISMVIQTTITASPEKVEVQIKVQNRGNEPAVAIYPELQLGSAEVKLNQLNTMAVNDSNQWTHTFLPGEAGLKLYGTYPLLITLIYHDSNMYAMSIPEVVLFELVKGGKELSFTGRIETTDVQDTGQVKLTLDNSTDRAVAGQFRVLLPKELTTANKSGTFELQANKTSQLRFPITNMGALVGSSYKIFAIMEFDESGSHYCVLASAMIKVKKPVDKDSGRFLIIGGGSFIFLLFLLMVFFELRRREN
jgi:hypothetical protein